MLRIITALTSVAILLSGCVTFYKNPGQGDLAAIFIEKGERSALDWYRYFKLAEIDGLPVSHMFASSDGNEIRVEPGTRRILFQVDYMNGIAHHQHRALFPLQLTVEPGKRYQIGGSAQDDNVVFTIIDTSDPGAPWAQVTAVGRLVAGDLTIGVPRGGFVTIPSRQ